MQPWCHLSWESFETSKLAWIDFLFNYHVHVGHGTTMMNQTTLKMQVSHLGVRLSFWNLNSMPFEPHNRVACRHFH
jgi:hypothetical protein